MEQQEKKRRTMQRKRATLSSLPIDIISKILSKLPAKSVARFRCVSKLCSSLTTDPYITNSFYTSSSKRQSLLIFLKESDKLFVISTPQPYTSRKPRINCYHIQLPKEYTYYGGNNYFHPTESVNGLICFQKSSRPIVWNPSVRKFFTLPIPKSSWEGIRIILGYDPVESKHKVVCFPLSRTHRECRVLTLGSTERTWRTVKTNHKHRRCKYGRCINGVVYYKAFDRKNVRIIMSFDVRSEKFEKIKLPPKYNKGILISYEGRLASVNSTKEGGLKLWILEDAKKHEWSNKYFSALRGHDDQSLKTQLRVQGFTDAGEFIFVPSKIQKQFYVLYFDPKRRSFTKVEFGGVAYDQFRICNGLGNLSRYALHTSPNHIESVMYL